MRSERAQRRYERILALRGQSMPETVEACGSTWRRAKVFKHDFFAATGLYQNGDRQAVLKIFRPKGFYGIPFGLLSRFQARHEEKLYRLLADTGNVPAWMGRYGETGFLHQFIPGSHLTPDAKVPEDLVDRLEKLILTMHDRGISYLDTNKLHNVIMGDDGEFYLIDFQITWVQPPFPFSLLTWPMFAVFKKSDRYHLMKQRSRLYPDKVSWDEIRTSRPWFIRLHRAIANPVRRKRRAILRRIEREASEHPEGAEFH